MDSNTHIRVGVMRGGRGHEYEVSLKTGGSVLEHLPSKYKGYDILITKDGTWHLEGVPVTVAELGNRIDVVFNALHGEYGEDGKVQRDLSLLAIPFTGSGMYASAIAMNKLLSKDHLKEAPFKVPLSVVVERGEDMNKRTLELFRSFPQPCIIKPISGGSSVGVSIAHSFNELLAALKEGLETADRVLVEEYIKGREATVGVIDAYRGAEHYVLPVIEIRIPEKHDFFDYETKYSEEADHVCPGNFTREEKRALEEAARFAHKTLGLKHYSRSDFIVSPRGIYFLEANTLPGLTSVSLFPRSLRAVGANLSEFIDHVLTRALQRE